MHGLSQRNLPQGYFNGHSNGTNSDSPRVWVSTSWACRWRPSSREAGQLPVQPRLGRGRFGLESEFVQFSRISIQGLLYFLKFLRKIDNFPIIVKQCCCRSDGKALDWYIQKTS